MAPHFWVGGPTPGNWSDPNRWSATSGGAGGAGVPGPGDDVTYNTASGGGQCVVDVAVAQCKSLTFTSSPITLGLGINTLEIFGGLTFGSAMTLGIALGAVIRFRATDDNGGAGWPIATASKAMPDVEFAGVGGRWQFTGTFVGISTTQAATLTDGVLDTNSKLVKWGRFRSNNGHPGRQLLLAASSVQLAIDSDVAWNVDAPGSGLTITPGTSDLQVLGDTSTFNGGGHTYGTVEISGAGICTVDGANTFGALKRLPPAAFNPELVLNADQVVTGTFTARAADVRHPFLVHSDSLGTARRITAGARDLQDVAFQDVTALGAAAPFAGTNIGDGGGCGGTVTGRVAVTRWWFGGAGDYDDPAHWGIASGGAGGSPGLVPLPQDPVRLDAASFSADDQVLNVTLYRLGADFDMTGCRPVVLAFGSPERAVYGNIVLAPGTKFTGSATLMSARGRTAGQTIRTNGATVDVPINVRAPGGTYTLLDDLNGRTVVLDAGTFDANDRAVTLHNFDASQRIYDRSLRMGNGVWTLTGTGTIWDLTNPTGLSLDAEGSRIVVAAAAADQTFVGGAGKVYHDLEVQGGDVGRLIIAGPDTYHAVTVHGARTVLFPVEGTAVDTLTTDGSPVAFATLRSNADGTPWPVAIASVSSCAYVNVKDSHASGPGSPVYALVAGQDAGGNTGWIFALGGTESGSADAGVESGSAEVDVEAGPDGVTTELASASATVESGGSASGPGS